MAKSFFPAKCSFLALVLTSASIIPSAKAEFWIDNFGPPKASANAISADGAYRQTMLAWPWLTKNPSNWQKFHYAERVSVWAEQVQPISEFNPSKLPQTSQAELKLMDALRELDGIKDSDGHRAALEYVDQVEHPIRSFLEDQLKDQVKEKGVALIFGETIVKYYSWAGYGIALSSPVPIADDEMLMRDALKRSLSNQLEKYRRARTDERKRQDDAAAAAAARNQQRIEAERKAAEEAEGRRHRIAQEAYERQLAEERRRNDEAARAAYEKSKRESEEQGRKQAAEMQARQDAMLRAQHEARQKYEAEQRRLYGQYGGDSSSHSVIPGRP